MMRRKAFRLKLPSRTLLLGERTLVMGVLNVTPDSFSDGGQFLDATRAIEHALAIESAGADVLDIGGESTRPGSSGTPAEEELARVLPVLQRLRGRDRKSTRLNSSHGYISYAVFCLKKKSRPQSGLLVSYYRRFDMSSLRST